MEGKIWYRSHNCKTEFSQQKRLVGVSDHINVQVWIQVQQDYLHGYKHT